MTEMKASQALVKELENWGIDHVYGIPADSIIDGFAPEQASVNYIQVRHEEVGALAAAAETKLTGKIGVALASVGPGAVHLLYGMVDAKMDRTPMLLIMSTVATSMINTRFIQDMDENELFASLDTFHEQVSNPQQIPSTIRRAITAAYETQSPSVVIIPDNLASKMIDYTALPVQQATKPKTSGTSEQVYETINLIKGAQRPVMVVGTGIKNAKAAVIGVSKRFGLPVISSAPASGMVPSNFENFMGSQGRMGTQPAYEVLHAADLVLMVGSSNPFVRFLSKDVTFIQVNDRAADLGREAPATQLILADAGTYLQQLIEAQPDRLPETAFLHASQKSRANWLHYLDARAAERPDGLLTAEGVLKAVGTLADADTIYGLDIGNNTVWSTRMLPFDQNQKMTMSAWFGAMGYAVSAGIAAKIAQPNRRVITVSGDGGFSMIVQDILTQVQYQLPIINVVIENGGFGFIRQEKANSGQTDYALKFKNANWAGVADNMGAIGLRVTDDESLKAAIQKVNDLIAAGNKTPIVIDAIVSDQPPLETGRMALDPKVDTETDIQAFRDQYNFPADKYPALSTLIDQQ